VNVLLVEESADIRDVLEAVLAYCGALVTGAASARDALDAFRRTPARVVVVGGLLPTGEATRLVRVLRGALADERVAVVRVGAEAEPELRDGFDAHVRTPFDPWEFCRLVAGLARTA
jgi:CheY-like chemotaxis protein